MTDYRINAGPSVRIPHPAGTRANPFGTTPYGIDVPPPRRPQVYDYRGAKAPPGALGIEYMNPDDVILTDGATISIGPSGAPRVTLNKGYENGRAAARRGPVLVPIGPRGADVDINRERSRKNGPAWVVTEMVPSRQPWDYKRQGPQYEAFGNFNYGAVGDATWLPRDAWRRGAGLYQQRTGTSDRKFGSPFLGTGSYGDDPVDQYWIEQGIRYGARK